MKISSSQMQNLDGKGLRVGVVLPYFNDSLGLELYENTKSELFNMGVLESQIALVRVPGSLEVPFACKKMALSKKFDVIIALGIVIRGETSHYDYVCSESIRGCMDVSLSCGIPIIIGILTCENIGQVIDRVSKDKINKGKEFAESAVVMAKLDK